MQKLVEYIIYNIWAWIRLTIVTTVEKNGQNNTWRANLPRMGGEPTPMWGKFAYFDKYFLTVDYSD